MKGTTYAGNRATVTAVTLLFTIVLTSQAATITWTNLAGGTWSNPNNWNPNLVPGANDTAVITNNAVAVTLDVSPIVRGVILGANANCGGGVATLFLNGQTLTLDGSMVVNSCGQFTVDSGAFAGTTNSLISGTIGWTGGRLAGTLAIASNGALRVSGPADHDLPDCTLVNNGAVVWSGGRIRGGGGSPGTFIYNNGSWDAQDDLTWNNDFQGNGTAFNNLGTFRKSAGTNNNQTLLTGGVLFNQMGGAIDVQQGNLVLGGGGNFTGGYVTTNVNGFTYLGSGGFTLNGTVTSSNVIENAGNLAGTNVIRGAMQWQAGNWNGAQMVTVGTNSTLYINTSADHDLGNCTCTNLGTVAWSNGRIRGGGASPGTIIYNYGLWDSEDDLTWNNDLQGNGTTFYNVGSLRKSGTSGGNTTFTGGVFLNNTGNIDSRTNYIVLSGGGSFTGGTATNLVGYVYLNGGAFNFNGTVTSTNVQLAGATLTGNNTIIGGFNWIVGSWNNSASETIAANSTLLITSGNDHDMGNCVVTNNGIVAWSAGRIRGGEVPGTFVYNYGVWDALDDLTWNNDLQGNGTTFNNLGTFRKSAGTNNNQTLLTGGVLFNQMGGAVDVQEGNLVLGGGGNFTGGYVTTNVNGFTYLASGGFTVNGTVTSSNVIENAGNLVGTNIIRGAMQWQAGNWNGGQVVTLASNSVLYVNTTADHDLGDCIVTNFGTVAWSGGRIRGGGGSPGTMIYNYGLWDSQDDLTWNNDLQGNGTTFNNAGTLRKSGSSGGNTTFTGGVFLNNTGNLDSRINYFVLSGGGSFTGGTATNLVGYVYLNSGAFNFNGTVTSTNVQLAGATLTGNNLIIGGFNWIVGDWNGSASETIAANSTLLITSVNDHNLANCVVTNNGTVAWSGGRIRGGAVPGTSIFNYGVWDAQADLTWNNDYQGNGTAFNNLGDFRKSAGTNNSQTLFTGGVLFNQIGGVVDVQQGNLVLNGGGNFTGGYVTTNVDGLTYLSSGGFTINGGITSGSVLENGGNLVGTNVIRGAIQWQAGNWNSAQIVTVATNSVLYVNTAADHDLADCVVTNSGTVAWSGGRIRGGGGSPGTMIYNYGVWDSQDDLTWNNDLQGNGTTFNNTGRFLKSGGTNTSSTLLTGGVFFNNLGRLDCEIGVMSLQGGFNLTNGVLNSGINSLTNYGQISLGGAAPLTGTISANLNHGYVPIAGNSFTNLFYGSFSGIFTNATLPSADAWATNYYPGYFVLTVLNARPSFVALATNTFFVDELTLLSLTNTASDPDLPPQTLTFSLNSAPKGMTITGLGAKSAVVNWTPAQTNSPSTNLVSVVVTDSGTPPLTATNSFLVVVREVNVAPTLSNISTQTVDELSSLTVTNTARETNIHSVTIGYGLLNSPTGMKVSTSGVISWMPTQTQSPGTNLVTMVVTNSNPYDLIRPQLTATNSFYVVVREVNVRPSFSNISTQTVGELTLLTVTNTASESNIHSTTTGYGLLAAPFGMRIDTNGIITWTPSQTQSPSTNLVITVVTNSNTYDLLNPHLTATNSFFVLVREVNVAPTLPAISNQFVNELTQLIVTNTATETNIHSTTGYFLLQFPDGASITTNGIITWTPEQTQSPSTNLFVTVATNSNPYDLINPHLAATNSFMVIVREVNVPPVLPVISSQVANQAYLFTVTNAASEPNEHSITTSYTLLTAPIGMNIDSAGLITWTPSQAQSPSTNIVITVVTNSNPYDLVNPHLSASNSFTVIVHPAVVLTNTTLSFSTGGFQFGFDTFPGLNYVIQYTTNLHDWVVLSILSGTGGHTNFLDSDALRDRHRFYRVRVEE